MLIKQAGCENYKEGDAVISQKHCNFFGLSSSNQKTHDPVKRPVLCKWSSA